MMKKILGIVVLGLFLTSNTAFTKELLLECTGKYADFFVKININEEIESLNISNSAAIVFHHLS